MLGSQNTWTEFLANQNTVATNAKLVCLKMAVFEVYSHPELRRYKTHVCSKASLVQLFCLALTWIPPLLIALRSQGMEC